MKNYVRIFSLFMLLSGLYSCLHYQRYRLPTERLEKLINKPLDHYLIDPAHPQTNVWYMSKVEVQPNRVICNITKMAPAEAMEITLIRSRMDATWSKNDVLFYPDQAFLALLPETGRIEITTNDLEKIEVYEVNQVKTFGTPLIVLLGLLVVSYSLSL
ncbi:MAG: hypothetical protein JNJ57_15135 [Saprospiraceae bacterium]|nr:hypothetical protein [Saprospiraceae bacterium]